MAAGDTQVDPRVSVIIPVRNRRDLLGATLDALGAQTVADHEVIVIDDGSTDGSGDLARECAAADQRVRVLDGDGRGAVAARTVGVEAARAPVLAFTDSDCVPDERWLEAGLARIDAGADVVQGLTRPVRPTRPLERSVWSMRDDGLFATCNVLYRRSAFEAAGGFDGRAGDRLGFRPGSRLRGYGFGEDTLVGWRVRKAGRAEFAPDAIVGHAVFPVDVADALTRAWTMGAFPGLFREIPELRALLEEDLRLGLRRRAPVYLLGAAGLLRWRRLALVAIVVWVGGHVLELQRTEPSRLRRAKVLPLLLALDATHAVALVWGSIRARTPVL
jgi:glycosyltransferase involved in cell wall biosynthesis